MSDTTVKVADVVRGMMLDESGALKVEPLSFGVTFQSEFGREDTHVKTLEAAREAQKRHMQAFKVVVRVLHDNGSFATSRGRRKADAPVVVKQRDLARAYAVSQDTVKRILASIRDAETRQANTKRLTDAARESGLIVKGEDNSAVTDAIRSAVATGNADTVSSALKSLQSKTVPTVITGPSVADALDSLRKSEDVILKMIVTDTDAENLKRLGALLATLTRHVNSLAVKA